jgi:hypothetical protein
MADNRMYLVHKASRKKLLLAKCYDGWSVFFPHDLPERMQILLSDGGQGNEWELEYEHEGQM